MWPAEIRTLKHRAVAVRRNTTTLAHLRSRGETAALSRVLAVTDRNTNVWSQRLSNAPCRKTCFIHVLIFLQCVKDLLWLLVFKFLLVALTCSAIIPKLLPCVSKILDRYRKYKRHYFLCSTGFFMGHDTRHFGFRQFLWGTLCCVVANWYHTAKKMHTWECHRLFGKRYILKSFFNCSWLVDSGVLQKRPCKSLRLWSLPVLSLPSVSFLMNSDSVNSCYSLGHLLLIPPPHFSCEKWTFARSENSCNTGTPAGWGNPSWISSQC